MATFQRKGNSVGITRGNDYFAVPAQAVIFPDPRNKNIIVISDRFNTQKEFEGVRVNINDVTGIEFADRNELIQKLQEDFFFNSVIITPLGGIAVRMTNKTGAASVKGTVVQASESVENAVGVIPANNDDPVGIIYENGVADGDDVYVVISGIAEVLVQNEMAVGYGYHAWVSQTVAGRIGLSSGINTDRHWGEIGHSLESKQAGTNVLAKCILHFN